MRRKLDKYFEIIAAKSAATSENEESCTAKFSIESYR